MYGVCTEERIKTCYSPTEISPADWSHSSDAATYMYMYLSHCTKYLHTIALLATHMAATRSVSLLVTHPNYCYYYFGLNHILIVSMLLSVYSSILTVHPATMTDAFPRLWNHFFSSLLKYRLLRLSCDHSNSKTPTKCIELKRRIDATIGT